MDLTCLINSPYRRSASGFGLRLTSVCMETKLAGDPPREEYEEELHGARSQSAVAGFPRRVTAERAARTLAGNTAMKNRMRANPAARLVRENSKPTAPAISQKPVKNTRARAREKRA